jgi:hypothetical protein
MSSYTLDHFTFLISEFLFSIIILMILHTSCTPGFSIRSFFQTIHLDFLEFDHLDPQIYQTLMKFPFRDIFYTIYCRNNTNLVNCNLLYMRFHEIVQI